MDELKDQEVQPQEEASEEDFELNHTDKLVGVFSEPGTTFKRMSNVGVKTTDWLIPILVVIIVSILSNYVMMSNPTIKYSIMEKQMTAIEERFDEMVKSGQMTEAQKEQQLQQTRDFMENQGNTQMIFSTLGILIFTFLMFFIVSGVFFAVFKLNLFDNLYLIASVIGFVAFFLPWLGGEFLGSHSGLDLFTYGYHLGDYKAWLFILLPLSFLFLVINRLGYFTKISSVFVKIVEIIPIALILLSFVYVADVTGIKITDSSEMNSKFLEVFKIGLPLTLLASLVVVFQPISKVTQQSDYIENNSTEITTANDKKKSNVTYKHAMSVYGLAHYIIVIQVIVMVILAFVLDRFIQGTSIAAIEDYDKATLLGWIYSKLDIFSIWFYAVIAVGFAKIFKSESYGRYFGMIFGLWIVVSLTLWFLADALPFLRWFGV